MKNMLVAGFVVAVLAGAPALQAQEVPKAQQPEKEHEWLQQLVGEWESEAEATTAPGQPPVKIKGTESVRTVGGIWVIAENKSNFMGQSITGILTLGYDPQKKKYVGSWVDSMTSYLWTYDGTVDSAGKTLTLLTEGPSPTGGGKLAKFKEVIELKGKDHKTFSSSVQTDDGKWVTFVTVNYRRKK